MDFSYEMTLYEYVRQIVPPPRARQILSAQLMEGVRFLGEQKIVHRDLKSDNLLLDFSLPGELRVA